MMIPITTDAPIYHRPFVTVVFIAVNSAVYFLAGQPDDLKLSLGNGWHPSQWISAAFLHGSLWHLVGNMIFLWAYGLVVEGKLGWWRFLGAYLLIAVAQHVVVQSIFGGIGDRTSGQSLRYVLGSSGAISGLMAMALLWAPVNEFTVVWGYSLGWHAFARDEEVSIWAFSLWFIGWDALVACLVGFQLCTPVLHFTGVLIGLILGFCLLQWKWVDCDRGDVFSLWSGCRGTPWKQLHSISWKIRRSIQDKRRPRKRRAELPVIVYPQPKQSATRSNRSARG